MEILLSETEYKQRLFKIQDLLKSHNMDALFCTPGTNFQYLYRSTAHMLERLALAVLTPNNPAELICPAFEFSNFEKNTPIPPDRIHVWEEIENPYKLLLEVSKSLGIDDGNIALSPNTPFTIFKQIQNNLSQVNFHDAREFLATARITKTDTEVKLLRKANEFTAKGIEATFDQLQVGQTEKQISQIVAKELSERSGEPMTFAAVQIEDNSAHPHGDPTDKKLQQDNVVLIDAGTTVEGYNGDITNTTYFGNPSKEFLEIYDLVEEANQRAIDIARAGELPKNVDLAAREYLESKDYGKYFTHRTGHGIGLEVHEDPYIVDSNTIALEKNQVFSIEPGIYQLGKFGVRIEDIVIAGEKKGERTYSPIRKYWEKA